MSAKKFVKDFKGSLIPRDSARKIENQWYEEGKTCFLMEDGLWYRITSVNKIVYDWELKKYILLKTAGPLAIGLVDDGTIGKFTPTNNNVKLAFKKPAFVKSLTFDLLNPTGSGTQDTEATTAWKKNQYMARTAEIAEKYGYIESIYDGLFYKESDCTSQDLQLIKTPNIPNGERSNTYSMEDDQAGKIRLMHDYDEHNPKIEMGLKKLAKHIPFSFGIEFETSNGFIPARLRNKLGTRPLRDGSIGGIEFTTIPKYGAKGLKTTKMLCAELGKRTLIDNKCSMHVHFGGVRRDQLYILSLWNILSKIQKEFASYFPYSRTNSIRSDGKVYCKPLPDLGLRLEELTKAQDKEAFHKALYNEFNKIYCWLNNEKHLGLEYSRTRDKKLNFNDNKMTWKFKETVHVFSIKNKKHSIDGNKWDRPQRYYWCNFLPTFFSPAETIEFRIHEATTNYQKTLMYMLLCSSILRYAENTKRGISNMPLTIQEILNDVLPKDVADHVNGYLASRKTIFTDSLGRFRSDWKVIENKWLLEDNMFLYKNRLIEEL